MSQRHAQAIQFVFLGLHPGEHLWSIQQQNTKLEKFLSRFDLFLIQGRINVLFCGIVLPKAK
jgi:hypothetical protein